MRDAGLNEFFLHIGDGAKIGGNLFFELASCKAIEMLCGLRIKSTLGLLLDVPAEEPQLFGSIVATPTRACRFRTTTPRLCPDITCRAFEHRYPFQISTGDVLDCLLALDIAVAPCDQRFPERSPPHRKADEPWHGGRHAKPFYNLLFIGAAPEDDASDLLAAVTARHFHDFETILASIQTFDLPDIGLNTGILKLFQRGHHQRGPQVAVVASSDRPPRQPSAHGWPAPAIRT